MSKYLTLYFINVGKEHLGKDVFLTPYYLGKELGYRTRIVYPMTKGNMTLPQIHRGVRLIPIHLFGRPIENPYLRLVVSIFFFIRYVVPSSCMMGFHYYSKVNVLLPVIYKLLNPWGKLYIKLDASVRFLQYEDNYKNKWSKRFWNFWDKLFALKVDCITCESSESYHAIMNSGASCYKFRNKLSIMPNAFDDEELQTIRRKGFSEKENIMITCGRLFTPPKNTEMLLNALKKIDIREWKFYFIGPYPYEAQSIIENFFGECQDKKGSVFFTGGIYDKKQLWEYYNQSKVFVLTSTSEGSPLVFVEATEFRNYILSTDVGGFQDITHNGKFGSSVMQNDPYDLSRKMQAIIDGKVHIDVYPNDFTGLHWSSVVKPVAEKLRRF